jgi:hypothetical protein
MRTKEAIEQKIEEIKKLQKDLYDDPIKNEALWGKCNDWPIELNLLNWVLQNEPS